MQKHLYVANWKMYMSRSSIDLFFKHVFADTTFAQYNTELILCPTFCFLEYVGQFCFKKDFPSIQLGAQDCSQFATGAHTGQVPATDIKAVGCTYAIIGHTEQRIHNQETDQTVLLKAQNLVSVGIKPIIGVGICQKNSNVAQACKYVANQLSFFIENIEKHTGLLFAYEPFYAIGSDMLPDIANEQKVINVMYATLSQYNQQSMCKILYGGNVNQQSVQLLKKIPHLDGFLIGRGSTDFQNLKNIIC
ncbi:triosephosphate isomerase [Candidatus Dependentiae bacterium]|nr:MAG: triosephosphate isomerase [Candidatus Dependentiae bacterium]